MKLMKQWPHADSLIITSFSVLYLVNRNKGSHILYHTALINALYQSDRTRQNGYHTALINARYPSDMTWQHGYHTALINVRYQSDRTWQHGYHTALINVRYQTDRTWQHGYHTALIIMCFIRVIWQVNMDTIRP